MARFGVYKLVLKFVFVGGFVFFGGSSNFEF